MLYDWDTNLSALQLQVWKIIVKLNRQHVEFVPFCSLRTIW